MGPRHLYMIIIIVNTSYSLYCSLFLIIIRSGSVVDQVLWWIRFCGGNSEGSSEGTGNSEGTGREQGGNREQ